MFVVLLVGINYADLLFPLFGVGAVDESREITTLGISAVIMILYNMIAWPYIMTKTLNKTQLQNFTDEKERAYGIVNQVYVTLNFCASI